MEFKKDDIIVLNEYGTKSIFGENVKGKQKKFGLYKVNFQINERTINIDSIKEPEYLGAFQSKYFRIATEAEIKKYKIKNIFDKRN